MLQKQTKPMIASKVNWLGLITMASAVASYVAGQINDKAAIGGIIVGALAIIFRSVGESKEITGFFKAKQ